MLHVFCKRKLSAIYQLLFRNYHLGVSFYLPEINRRFQNPQNRGRGTAANATGTSAALICGSILRLSLRIDSTSKIIQEAKYETNGCGYAIAAAEVLIGKIGGKSLINFHGLQSFEKEIRNEFGDFEAGRTHCLELSLSALETALQNFRLTGIEEWTGEKALICSCFGVGEETIERIVTEQNAKTVEDVARMCNAGGGCGSCQFLIQEMIDGWGRKF